MWRRGSTASLPDQYPPAARCPLCSREMSTPADNNVTIRYYDSNSINARLNSDCLNGDTDACRLVNMSSCCQSLCRLQAEEEINAATIAADAANSDSEQAGGICCSASSSDDEELFCLRIAKSMSSSDEDAASCCDYYRGSDSDEDTHAADCARIYGQDSGSDTISEGEVESDVPDSGAHDDEAEDDDEGFISFKFDDYPESVYEGVGGDPDLLLCPDGYCLCVRLRANLNESVKSR